MRKLLAVAAAAMTLAACQDNGPLAPADDPLMAKGGVSQPKTPVNLTAQFTTTMFSYISDGSSVAGAPPAEHSLDVPSSLLEGACSTTVGSFTTTTVCVTAVSLPVTYSAKCEAQTFTLGSLSLPFDGVLTGYVTPSIPTNVTTTTTLRNKSTNAIIGSPVTVSVALSSLPSSFQTLILGLMGGLEIGGVTVALNTPMQVGFFGRGKGPGDIPAPEDLLTLLQPLLDNPELISNPLDPALLELVLTPDMLQLMGTIFPLFVPPMHAYHPACESDVSQDITVYFSEKANFVQTPSGNQNLNFNAFTPLLQPFAGFVHYKGKKEGSDAGGLLLSNFGMFYINMAQFDDYSGNLIDALKSSSGIQAQACMTALPWKCVNTTLKWQ